MAQRGKSTPFHIAERAVLALYDGGVLSPAVLERVLAAFIEAQTDWNTSAERRSVDDRTLHEIVVMTMMPGRVPSNVARDFAKVMRQIAAQRADRERARDAASRQDDAPDEEEASSEDSALIEQLGRATRSKPSTRPARKRASTGSASRPASAGFNPFVNPKPPRKGP